LKRHNIEGVAREQDEWDIEGGWKGRRLIEGEEGGGGGGEEWSKRGEKWCGGEGEETGN
jgi:hypothetical protein